MSPSEPKNRLNYDAASFLSLISEPDEIRYIFVKATKNGSGSNLCGYYEAAKFGQVVEDIKQVDTEASGIYYGINALDRSRIAQELNCLKPTTTAKSPKKADILRRRILLIDIDPVRQPDTSSTIDEKTEAHLLAKIVHRDLKEAGWPSPVVVDSGNGYHLLYRIELPTDDEGIVRDCLKSLASKHDRDQIKIDTSVHDAVRLAKLSGTMACKGLSTPERPHRRAGHFKLPEEFKSVPHELLKELANQTPKKSSKNLAASRINQIPNQAVLARAHAYLAKMAPAISGANGRNQFFNAACRLVDDFALPGDHARPILVEYNQRCEPPFTDRELDDKLNSAIAKVTERGGPSGSALSGRIPVTSAASNRFLGYVPDFGLVTTQYVLTPLSNSVRPDQLLTYFFLWNHLHAYARIPDLFLRQWYWGATYDKNWKARMPKKVKLQLLTSKKQVCDGETCMLHGSGIRHQHYSNNMQKFGALDLFSRQSENSQSGPTRFHLFADEFKEHRLKLQKSGLLFNVYWPALVLGSSPKVGWTWPQQRLVVGLVRELTRTKPKPGEGITGEIIKRGQIISAYNGTGTVLCPLLDPSLDYVLFAGNGKRKGRGYRIIGQTGKGWLSRAGYGITPEMDKKERLAKLKSFLSDLHTLSKHLGLIPVGNYRTEWKSIDQMMDCLRKGLGQDWLESCNLRVFAPADWRRLWRRYFSDQLGFSWIPETPEGQDPENLTGSSHKASGFASGQEIRSFIKENRWSQKRLAEEIAKVTGNSCSVRRVERNLNKLRPSPDFFQDVDAVKANLEEYPQAESREDH